jgi:hypothetical protein
VHPDQGWRLRLVCRKDGEELRFVLANLLGVRGEADSRRAANHKVFAVGDDLDANIGQLCEQGMDAHIRISS